VRDKANRTENAVDKQSMSIFGHRNEPPMNVSEAAKPGAKISEKARFMGDKCEF